MITGFHDVLEKCSTPIPFFKFRNNIDPYILKEIESNKKTPLLAV